MDVGCGGMELTVFSTHRPIMVGHFCYIVLKSKTIENSAERASDTSVRRRLADDTWLAPHRRRSRAIVALPGFAPFMVGPIRVEQRTGAANLSTMSNEQPWKATLSVSPDLTC